MVVWKKERSNLKTPQWLTSNQNGRFGIHLALQHIFTTRAGAIGSKLWVALALLLAFVVGICCTYWNHTMLSCIGVGLARRYRGETQHRTSISSTQCEGRRSIFIFSVVFWCPYCCCLGISNASLWFTFSACFVLLRIILLLCRQGGDGHCCSCALWLGQNIIIFRPIATAGHSRFWTERKPTSIWHPRQLCFCQLLFISPPFHFIRSTSCMAFLLTRQH